MNSPLGSRYAIGGALGRSVKRAGGAFSPTDVAGLALWVDFSDANTLFTDAGKTKVSSDGDLIYQANDKSVNANHLTYTTAKPIYKTGIKNGLSVSRWDNTSIGLLTANNLNISFGANGKTVFFVLYPTYFDSTNNVVFSSSNWIFYTFQWRVIDSTGERRWKSASGSVAWQVINLYHTGDNTNTYVLYKDGSLQTSSYTVAKTINTTADKLRLGQHPSLSYRDYEGDMAEAIVYDGVLSDADRNAVTTYLNAKW